MFDRPAQAEPYLASPSPSLIEAAQAALLRQQANVAAIAPAQRQALRSRVLADSARFSSLIEEEDGPALAASHAKAEAEPANAAAMGRVLFVGCPGKPMKVVLFATAAGPESGDLAIGVVDDSGVHEFQACGTLAGVGAQLKPWIEQFDDRVQFHTASLDRDSLAIQRLIEAMESKPQNLDGKLVQLGFGPGEQERFDASVFAAYAEGLRRDRVLDVARANQRGWAAALSWDLMLFLDFDGVLHPAGVREESYLVDMPALASVLRRFKDNVGVVISSTWRESESLEQLRGYFDQDLQHLIVGVTPVLRGQNRQAECLAWLHKRAPGARWLAIDDDARGFESGCENLFLVPKTGLEPAVADALSERIASAMTAGRP